jgi:hypothetical protein
VMILRMESFLILVSWPKKCRCNTYIMYEVRRKQGPLAPAFFIQSTPVFEASMVGVDGLSETAIPGPLCC